jgi:glutathione synthase/RimK-type ligase-like ATP-grasp enzyme
MIVLANRRTRLSANVLKQRLIEEDYQGKAINWGNSVSNYAQDHEVLNKPESVANAVNKHIALQMLKDGEVGTPLLLSDARTAVLEGIKIVGRPNYHSKGREYYIVSNEDEFNDAITRGATHFLTYIDDALEFRVHIVNGNSIKISQKVFSEEAQADAGRRNHRFGTVCVYPHDFNHKKSLRKVAKQAVEALNLDFGAVDILFKDDKYYVLEVNTAPCLTDEQSDTLDCYVKAFTDLEPQE